MIESQLDTVLIIASDQEYSKSYPIWGTGGWLTVEEREALDWLILCRFMGWNVKVTTQKELTGDLIRDNTIRWIIFACEPKQFKIGTLELLQQTLRDQPILFLSRFDEEAALISSWTEIYCVNSNVSGTKLTWTNEKEQKAWNLRNKITANALTADEEHQVILRLDGRTIGVQKKVGTSKIVLLGFHPSEARDSDAKTTAALKHILSHTPINPTAWFDWANTLILRMDDPGSAETVHHNIYSNNKLIQSEWQAIGDQLCQRKARLSIGYVAGWVDDGDPKLGSLKVNGAPVDRVPGKVYDSPVIKYVSHRTNLSGQLYDYEDEYQSILQLKAAQLVEVEMHGYTHIYPDRDTWLAAPDRYENEHWYREFGQDAISYSKQSNSPHPLKAAKKAFLQYFKSTPTTLICPGEVFTRDILVDALNERLMLVSSYYLAIRDEDRFCWSQHICAPYLNESHAHWFDSELPVVGYFHDFDLSTKGVNWLRDCLDGWQDAGAATMTDLSEVNGRLCNRLSVSEQNGEVTLSLINNEKFPLVRDVEIFLRLPQCELPKMVKVDHNGTTCDAVVEPFEYHTGKVTISPIV